MNVGLMANSYFFFFFEGRVETDGGLTSEAPPKSVNGELIFFLSLPQNSDING